MSRGIRRRNPKKARDVEPPLDTKRALINAIKQERGCFFCRERTAICLEFHHINPQTKRFSISEFRKYPFRVVLKEIEKCAVLCANCHRKVHGGMLPPLHF